LWRGGSPSITERRRKTRLDPSAVDSIVGHGDRRKDVRSLYVTISDEDLVKEIDRMNFDQGKTEIWVQK